ncbi:tetratricopeptide repeat protein, partial [Dolichospermum sp. ST_sed3]|nr:tetratricopeptide repeat protein [Dolichospermum sp. ST_sed3]
YNAIRSVLEYYKSRNLQQAASLCEEILTKNPDHITILYLLGVVYQQLQSYAAALKNPEAETAGRQNQTSNSRCYSRSFLQ